MAFFLLFGSAAMAQQTAEEAAPAPQVAAFDQAESRYKEVQKQLRKMEKQRKDLLDRMAAFDAEQKELLLLTEELEAVYDGVSSSLPVDSKRRSRTKVIEGDASKRFQEAQMSFNLQYLQLQQQMQNENRS